MSPKKQQKNRLTTKKSTINNSGAPQITVASSFLL